MSLISMVIGVMIVVVSALIVVPVIYDVINEGTVNAEINYGKTQLSKLDSVIRELSYEANGAKRSVRLNSRDGYFVVSGKEDSIKYISSAKGDGVSYKEGNMVVSSGSYIMTDERDIDNDGNVDLVLENNNLLLGIKKTGSSATYSELNTSILISLIRNKQKNIDMFPITKISVDNSSSYGNGYSELLPNTGSGVIRVVMNSTIDYEILFRLRPGSDWFEVEVNLL